MAPGDHTVIFTGRFPSMAEHQAAFERLRDASRACCDGWPLMVDPEFTTMQGPGAAAVCYDVPAGSSLLALAFVQRMVARRTPRGHPPHRPLLLGAWQFPGLAHGAVTLEVVTPALRGKSGREIVSAMSAGPEAVAPWRATLPLLYLEILGAMRTLRGLHARMVTALCAGRLDVPVETELSASTYPLMLNGIVRAALDTLEPTAEARWFDVRALPDAPPHDDPISDAIVAMREERRAS